MLVIPLSPSVICFVSDRRFDWIWLTTPNCGCKREPSTDTAPLLGAIAFAGFFTCVYLCGIKFFPREDGRLSLLALVGGFGVGVTTVVLSFEGIWHFSGTYPCFTIPKTSSMRAASSSAPILFIARTSIPLLLLYFI